MVTSARSRVWSGGSRMSMLGRGIVASCRADNVPLRGSLPKRRWSRRMAFTSAWRANTQALSSRLRCTGARSRSAA